MKRASWSGHVHAFRSFAAAIAIASGVAWGSAHAALATFDFEATPEGTSGFSDTSNGLTVSFDAGPFGVASIPPGIFAKLSGNVLADNDRVPGDLLIFFDQPIDALTLDFATNGPGTLTLFAALLSAALFVGETSVDAGIPPGIFLPEGTLTFAGSGAFDAVLLTSAVPDFAIDNLRATFGTVAEPGSLALFLLALTFLAASPSLCSRRRGGGDAVSTLDSADNGADRG